MNKTAEERRIPAAEVHGDGQGNGQDQYDKECVGHNNLIDN